MAVLMIAGMSLLFIGNSVNAWGGIYNNRFSPEMIQNMGYGSPHRIYQEVGHHLNIKVILAFSTLKTEREHHQKMMQIDLFVWSFVIDNGFSRIASIVLSGISSVI